MHAQRSSHRNGFVDCKSRLHRFNYDSDGSASWATWAQQSPHSLVMGLMYILLISLLRWDLLRNRIFLGWRKQVHWHFTKCGDNTSCYTTSSVYFHSSGRHVADNSAEDETFAWEKLRHRQHGPSISLSIAPKLGSSLAPPWDNNSWPKSLNSFLVVAGIIGTLTPIISASYRRWLGNSTSFDFVLTVKLGITRNSLDAPLTRHLFVCCYCPLFVRLFVAKESDAAAGPPLLARYCCSRSSSVAQKANSNNNTWAIGALSVTLAVQINAAFKISDPGMMADAGCCAEKIKNILRFPVLTWQW